MADTGEYYSTKRMRSNVYIFAGGKIANAALSFTILVLIASSLTKSDFAIYAWLLAFTEFTVNISRFGVNLLVLRYAPQLRSSQNLKALSRMILLTTFSRVVVMLVFGLVYYWGSYGLLSVLGKTEWLPAFELYIAVIIPFALVVFLRDTVFQSLFQQGHTQVNTTVRHAVFLIGLLSVLWIVNPVTVIEVIYVDIAATTTAAVLALIQGWILLRRFPYGEVEPTASVPSWSTMLKFAANSYASEILRMLGSGYSLMTIAPQMLTVAALAPFGFCLTLFGQIYRFLPAHLFSGLFRPKLIAEYTKSRSFERLNQQIIMILKISNYTLAAGISIFFVYGSDFLDLMSNGKYGSEYYLMLGFLILMLVDNHRLVLAELCSAIEKADLLRDASIANLTIIPIAVFLVALGLSYYGLVLAIIIGEGIFVATIIRKLWQAGYSLRFD
ncbi:MAG: lipopolysaccharide biosynthesis protein, partial [Geminicoccaceae bacterium]